MQHFYYETDKLGNRLDTWLSTPDGNIGNVEENEDKGSMENSTKELPEVPPEKSIESQDVVENGDSE